jgi:hypothetical protein
VYQQQQQALEPTAFMMSIRKLSLEHSAVASYIAEFLGKNQYPPLQEKFLWDFRLTQGRNGNVNPRKRPI